MFSKAYLKEEATHHELKKIVQMENKLNRDDLIHKAGNKKKDFQKFKTRYFGKEIHNNDLLLDDYRMASDRQFSDHKQPKILSPKQMIQTLPIAYEQVKTGK